MRVRAHYNYSVDPSTGDIYIVDLDLGVTVTNDAEAVINQINKELIDGGRSGLSNRRVTYRDTDGRVDELVVDKDGKFTGFRPLPQ